MSDRGKPVVVSSPDSPEVSILFYSVLFCSLLIYFVLFHSVLLYFCVTLFQSNLFNSFPFCSILFSSVLVLPSFLSCFILFQFIVAVVSVYFVLFCSIEGMHWCHFPSEMDLVAKQRGNNKRLSECGWTWHRFLQMTKWPVVRGIRFPDVDTREIDKASWQYTKASIFSCTSERLFNNCNTSNWRRKVKADKISLWFFKIHSIYCLVHGSETCFLE